MGQREMWIMRPGVCVGRSMVKPRWYLREREGERERREGGGIRERETRDRVMVRRPVHREEQAVPAGERERPGWGGERRD